MDLGVFIRPKVDFPALQRVLGDVGTPARVRAIRSWGPHELAILFEASQGQMPLTLEHFVPNGNDPGIEVIHHGHNSMPAFTRFQKRFARPQGATDVLVGYNEQPWRWFTGPGYFCARAHDVAGEVALDYTMVPSGKADGWPGIVPNERGFGRLVYANMIDIMRAISPHVSIGRAQRNGKWMDNWFALCREEPIHRAS